MSLKRLLVKRTWKGLIVLQPFFIICSTYPESLNFNPSGVLDTLQVRLLVKLHIVPLDLVEDAPKHFQNDLTADTISHS